MNVTTQAGWLKRLPSPIYKALAQSWMDKKYPRHIFIETTATCNLTCSYCPREKLKQDMDFDLFKGVIDEASYFGRRSFSLHILGEPLLYPKIWEAIEYIKQKNEHHTVLLTTNGTQINRQIKELVSSRVDRVFWTVRSEASFTEAVKQDLARWGKFVVRIIPEITSPEQLQAWKDWKPKECTPLTNFGGNIDLSRWGKADTNLTSGTKRWPCYFLWLAPAIAADGSILICCNDPKRKSTFGKFPEVSVAKVWQSREMAALRNEQLKGSYSGICRNCDVWRRYPNMFFDWQR